MFDAEFCLHKRVHLKLVNVAPLPHSPMASEMALPRLDKNALVGIWIETCLWGMIASRLPVRAFCLHWPNRNEVSASTSRYRGPKFLLSNLKCHHLHRCNVRSYKEAPFSGVSLSRGRNVSQKYTAVFLRLLAITSIALFLFATAHVALSLRELLEAFIDVPQPADPTYAILYWSINSRGIAVAKTVLYDTSVSRRSRYRLLRFLADSGFRSSFRI